MMRTLRSWKRESRLLLIVAELSGSGADTALEVLTVDFLLQHPSLLRRIVRHGASGLPAAAEPTAAEAESSEEDFLRWKRSVVDQVVAPMLGRLIARGLIAQSPAGGLVVRPLGENVADELRPGMNPREASRLRALAGQVQKDRAQAREWLQAALAEGPN